jgi:UDP-N-acetylglucosamine 2-epimerase (non-hydrolysing)
VLQKICRGLKEASEIVPVILPLHPRTRRRMTESGVLETLQESERIHLPEPLGYVRFMSLVFSSRFVVTDSGGVQEETSYLGIPCLTLRDNTERPITLTSGTNRLCTLESLVPSIRDIVRGPVRKQTSIDRWDGRTSERIVAALRTILAPGRPLYAPV